MIPRAEQLASGADGQRFETRSLLAVAPHSYARLALTGVRFP